MTFIVYTRPGCPYCTQIKQVLEGKKYGYTEYQLNKDFTREEFYGEFGPGTTFLKFFWIRRRSVVAQNRFAILGKTT